MHSEGLGATTFFQSTNLQKNINMQNIYLSSKENCDRVKPCVNLIIVCVHMHSITAVMLVSQNNETVALFVSQANHVGIELFFIFINTFCCSNTINVRGRSPCE